MTRKAAATSLPVLPLGSAAKAADPHVISVPGALAPTYPVDLPTGLRHGTRERIARRQISERLGIPENVLDIRPVGSDPEWSHVLVVEHDRAEAWRTEGAGPGCSAILPDYLTLPAFEDVWTLRADSENVAVRLGPDDGFGATADLAAAQLRLAAKTPPKGVLLLNALPANVMKALEVMSIPIFRSLEDVAAADVSGPSAGPDRGGRLNLLEPADAAVRNLRQSLRRWLWPGLAACLALALWVAGTIWQITQADTRIAAVQAQTNQLLRNTFVPSGPILDVRLQVTRRLSEIGADTSASADTPSPVALFRRAAAVFAAADVTVDAISFRPQSGLEAAVQSPDFARVETLANGLRAAGLTVAVLDAQTEDGGQVAARLQLGGN